MKFRITATGGSLKEYKNIIENYNHEKFIDEGCDCESIIVDFKDLENVMCFVEQLNEVILSFHKGINYLEIYDDYRE